MPEFAALPAPLPEWKPAEAARPWTPFSATYTQTLNLLGREAGHLGARSILVQVVTAGGNTRGGNLRSDARVDHPGVVVTLDTPRRGTLVYETDEYRGHSKAPGWQANLRAVALGLEALRKVDRYGISRGGQQYAGFRELGAGQIELGAGMTLDQAARLLGDAAGEPWEDILSGATSPGACLRLASKTMHPDVGGDPDVFASLVRARDLLNASGR